MNILQRRMFANGDVVNQPLVDVTTEIANLSRQGLAPVEIFERLQRDYAAMGVPFPLDLGMATIERIARQVGGSMKIPDGTTGGLQSLQDPQIDNIFPPTPDGPFVIDKSLPSVTNVPDFASDIKAISEDSITNNIAATEQSLTPNLILPDLSNSAFAEGTSEDTTLPQVVKKELGPNEIRLSDGKVIDFSQGIKNIEQGTAVDTRLYRLYNSPDIERGANVEKALESFIARDEPGLNRLFSGYPYEPSASERRGGFFAPEDIGSSFYQLVRKGRDVLMEGGEKVAGGLDFFLGEEDAQKYQDFFEGDRFSESPGYFERGGLSKEEIDRLALITAGINPDQIATDLKEVEDISTKTDTEIIAEQQADEEENLETTDSLADKVVEGDKPDTGEESDTGEVPDTGTDLPGAIDEDAPPPPPKSKETKFAEFTTSPDFIRFIRNIGKGLVTTGEIGKGIALGSAAAAEEKAQEEALKAEREAELLKEMKEKGGSKLSPSDIKGLNTQVTDLNKVIKEYEGGESSIGLMNELIGLFTTAEQRGVAVSGLGGQFNIAMDKLKTFLGRDFDTSDATQIQQAINQVKQRSIRDILQESGRTISDLDRQIVDKIFGEIDLFTPPDQIAKKLRKARNDLIDSNREKQRTISTSYDLIQNPVYEGVGIQAVSPYISLIDKILKSDPTKGSGISLSEVFDIDVRSLELLR